MLTIAVIISMFVTSIDMRGGCQASSISKKLDRSLIKLVNDTGEKNLSNPIVQKDDKLYAGQRVTYDCIWFGEYLQKDTNGDGKVNVLDKKQKIKWRILQVENNKALILSDKILDIKWYIEGCNTSVTWENSRMRSWLNGYSEMENKESLDFSKDSFINTAFNLEEKKAITVTRVVTPDNEKKGTFGGSDTDDRMFLLSANECWESAYGFTKNQYDEAKQAKITEYVAQNREEMVMPNAESFSSWLLRTPDSYQTLAGKVWADGEVVITSYTAGSMYSNNFDGVRPACWIDLSKLDDYQYAGTVCSDGTVDENNPDETIIKDFSEYPYRADVQMDMSIPSSKTWKNVINTEGACKQISEALDDEGMRTTAYWWKLIQEGIASVDNPEEVAEISFSQKDMYKAIIFNSLLKCKDIEFKDEDIGKFDEEDVLPNIIVDPDIAYGGLKTVNKVTGIVTKWAKTNGELSLLEDITSQNSSRKWSTLSLSQQEDILKDVGEFYDNISGSTQISEAIKFLNKVGTIAKVCDTVVDCIEYISNYIYMYQLTDAQKAAVYTMYQVCPSDNQVLKSSLKEVYDILTSSQLEFIESITSGTSMIAGRVVTATWLDLYWKSVKAKIVASCPYVMIFWAAIKTTTFATNVLLGTDDAVEAYYNMLGMKEFHSVVQAAYDNLQDVYVASESTQDAETYITATNILYHCIDQDYEYALNYLKPLDKSFVNKVSKIFGRDSFDATMSTLKNYQSSASSAYNTLLYAWIYELENDYPEEYENYKKYLDSYETEIVKSYRIACPVDVYIYDSDDQLVGKVENNVPYVCSNEVTIVVENDIKTLYFTNKSEKYHLKLTGTDIGKMDIEIEEYSKGQVARNVEFYDVPLEKELSYTLSGDGKVLQKKEYSLSNENSGETIRTNFDSLLVGEKQKHVLKVNNGVAYKDDETPTKTMEVYEGQKIQITSVVNNKKDFLGWKADDSSTVFEEPATETTFVIIGNSDVNITALYKNMADSSNTPNPSVTEQPSETSPSPNPEQTSTSTPSVDASSQPNLTPTQQPNETSPIPSTPATVQPSMDPIVQPSATVAPSQNTTVKTALKPKISNRNNSDKNSSAKKKRIAMKGNTFVGSHGTALYKIIDTGKRNTVSYIRNLKKSREKVKIPSSIKYKGVNYKVTSIEKRAFYQNKKLKKIVFGKNIIQIGKKAFYRCNSLKVIKLNKKLSEIGDSAFSTCIKLQYVAISKSVKWIGKRAFYGCKKLRYILVKSNQLTNKRVGRDSFAKGYKKVRVKTSKKKWRSYAKAMILKGKLSSRATFVVEPVPLILKK